MSGSRDRFDDDGELEQLAQDLDLDMDAPIGATFAAALRGQSADPHAFQEADFGLDDDGFMTPPPHQAPAAHPAPAVFADAPQDAEHAEMSFEDEFSDEGEDFDPPPPAAYAQPAPPPMQADGWLQPKPSAPPAEDLPPMTIADMEPVAEEDAAGQGLGFDYSFGSAHTAQRQLRSR